MGGAKLRIRQAYSGGSAMRVTAAHIEVSYNPREIASVVLRPASDGNSSTALSPGSIVPSPAWPATASANDATYIRANEHTAYQQMLLGPAVPTRFRARQSELHPKLTPSVELDSTSWLNGTGQQRFETLRLNEDVDTSWGDFATLEQSDSNAVTVTAFDTDANTFGFASPTGIYAPKLISSFVFNAKGTPSSGSVTLKVWMRINHVWTSVKTLVFTGGYQHRSAAWDGYALSQNQLDDLQVQVWFDGLSGSDTFSFEYCEVTIEGVTPQKNTTIQSPLIGYGDPVDTWQDFSLPVYHGATPHGFHTVTSLTLAGGGVADRDTWVWPMVTVEHAFNASTGGSSSGTFDVSEVEVVVWYSAFMNVPSSTYLFRLMQGTNTMIRDAANQRWWVYAFDVSTGLPKTGDASNITATIFQNNGSSVGTDDTNPNELGNGFYTFDLTQAETAAHTITLIPVSSTENISVVPCPAVVSPHPANYGLLGIEVDGDITKVNTLHGHTAQTADHETRLAAAASSLTAQDAILSALPDAGALTDLGTITDRLGAFTGTGINNVLGFLKALGSKAATAPSDMGGTFAPSDDSLEAIRDRGDAAYVPPSTGSGAYDVTITVEDEADNPLGGAQVRMVLGASVSEGTTATDGTLTLKCDNGSWDIGITHVTSVSYSGTVTVNGNTTPATFELAQTVTSTPSDAGRSTGQILLMTDGSPDVGATYSILYSRGGDLAGVSADRSIQTATTNSSGIAQFPNLIQDAYYTLLGRGDGTVAASVSPFARRSADRLGEFQVPATNPFLITE
jgi:hypothetical protein